MITAALSFMNVTVKDCSHTRFPNCSALHTSQLGYILAANHQRNISAIHILGDMPLILESRAAAGVPNLRPLEASPSSTLPTSIIAHRDHVVENTPIQNVPTWPNSPTVMHVYSRLANRQPEKVKPQDTQSAIIQGFE